MTEKKLWVRSPNGSDIVGTADTVLVSAWINTDSWERDADGALGYDNQGSSEVHWDTQETRKNDKGQWLYVDECGDEWPEDELVVTDHDPDEGEAPATGDDKLVGALKGMLDIYLELVHSGDAGNWDPEQDPKVIEVRAALAAAGAS